MAQNYVCHTPVVLFIYHRPDITSKTLEAIAKVKPKKLYIIADGPEDNNDSELCKKTREVAEKITWECEVIKNYSTKNLGLRKRVVTGLDNVFKKEKSAIIIEDDCVADLSFFKFAEEMLIKYEKKQNVYAIAGYNNNPDREKQSYHFSKYVESWGWATWSRAWKHYDNKMIGWSKRREQKWLQSIIKNSIVAYYWQYIFDLTIKNKFDSWAYRWMYSVLERNGLTIVPKNNLITNIGFGNNATNTKKKYAIPKIKSITFPLVHPPSIEINQKLDRIFENSLVRNPITYLGLIKKMLLG